MGSPLYHVDAFTSVPFAGNPAAVCLVDEFPDEAWMQSLGAELGLSETAFVVPRGGAEFDLRWFTPSVEVDLCGHATIAASHVLWDTGIVADDTGITFASKSGSPLRWRSRKCRARSVK